MNKTSGLNPFLCGLLLCAGIAVTPVFGQEHDQDIPTKMAKLLKDHAGYRFEEPMDWQAQILEWMQDVYGDRKLTRAVEKVMLDFLLSEATYAAKKMIWMEFANIVSDQSVPALIELLDGQEASTLALLILQKADLKDKEALMDRWSGLSELEKIGIIHHFGDNREEAAIDLLYGFTQGENQRVARAAWLALAKVGTVASAQMLLETFDKPDQPVDLGIYDALLSCAEQLLKNGQEARAVKLYETLLERDRPITVQSAALYGLFKLNEDSPAFIRDKLESVDPELRPDVIRMVRDLPKSFKQGNTFLRMEGISMENRIQLLLILASRRDPSARPYALEALAMEDAHVRRAALQALANIAIVDDVDRLLDFALSADKTEKDLALIALGSIPGQEADGRLMHHIRNASPEKLLVLIDLIRDRSIDGVTEKLLALCRNEDRRIQVEAIRTLGIVGDYPLLSKALDFLVESKSSSERRAWGKAVYQLALKNPSATNRFEGVVRKLDDVEDEPNVTSLVFILGEVKNPADYPLIKQYLANDNEGIRVAALKVLSEWPNAEPLDELLHQFKRSGDPKLRRMALQGALKLLDADRSIPNEDKLKMLGELMQEAGNAAEKRLVISGYGEIGVLGSLRVLVSWMENADYGPEVEASIRRIMRNVYISDREEARKEILKARELSDDNAFQHWVDDGLRRERFSN